MNMEQNKITLDLEKVLHTKNPKLARLLPQFIINYLKKIVRQKELNVFMSLYGHKKGIEFADSILDHMNVTYKVEGEKNIPKDGRFIFASNHPLGGPDGIMLIHFFGRKYPVVKFPVNDILLNIENFEEFFVPVNKEGAQARDNVNMIDNAYKSDAQILMFPAGYVSRKKRGVIADTPWTKSFISKAIQHKRDIIPIYMSGQNSNFFYNLSNIRKFLGLKTNLEMLYLPNELYKQIGNNFTIIIGKPIPYRLLTKDRNRLEWAKHIRNLVYELPEKL